MDANSTSIPTAERSMTSTLTTERLEEQDQRDYVDVQRLLDAPMKEVFILDDLPVLIEIPNVVIRDAWEILERPEPTQNIPIIRTPHRKPIVDPGFSIYAVSLSVVGVSLTVTRPDERYDLI